MISVRRRAQTLGAGALVGALLAACGAPPAVPGAPVVSTGRHLAGTPLDPLPTTSPGVMTWAPWPSALHDARHSGASTSDGPTAGTVRWRRTLEGAVTPGPVVGADGTVYAASNAGILHALDPTTGADRWTYDSGHRGGGDLSTSPLVLPDGTVLWGTNGGREWAYRADGTPKWDAQRVITYSSPAVTADGSPTSRTTPARVRVLCVTDGSEAAAYQLDPPQQIWSSVAVDRGHRVYFGTQDGHLLGVDPGGGVLFDVDLGAPVGSYPALTADGAVVVGGRDGELVAVG